MSVCVQVVKSKRTRMIETIMMTRNQNPFFPPVRNEKLKMLWFCFLKYRCTGKGQVFSIVL